MPDARVAVLYQDDDFGLDYYNTLLHGIEGSGIKEPGDPRWENDPAMQEYRDKITEHGFLLEAGQLVQFDGTGFQTIGALQDFEGETPIEDVPGVD